MYCKNCGKKLEENAIFCAKCGTKCKEEKADISINKYIEKIKKLDKKILIAIGIGLIVIILLISGAFGKKYTENMEKVRESGNIMYLGFREDGTGYKFGELLDVALRKSKWTEKNGLITITGKDSKTKKNIKIVFEVDGKDVEFSEFINGDKEGKVTDLYYWLRDYNKQLKK